MPDEEMILRESAMLDQSWMEAERFADLFIAIGGGAIPPLHSTEATCLMLKACSLVGLECKRRLRERTAN